jgi:hypothetical protein
MVLPARNAGTCSDQRTRTKKTNVGGLIAPHKGKEFMVHWGLQFGIAKDFRGTQLFIVYRDRKRRINIQKSLFLKRTKPVFVKAPEAKDPTVLAEKPNTYALTPEDIISGNFERPKGLTPEEIGDAKFR